MAEMWAEYTTNRLDCNVGFDLQGEVSGLNSLSKWYLLKAFEQGMDLLGTGHIKKK